MWRLGKRAERFGRLPSELMHLTSPLLAYWLDEAVEWWVRFVEGKLAERDKQNRPRYSLDALLGTRVYAEL